MFHGARAKWPVTFQDDVISFRKKEEEELTTTKIQTGEISEAKDIRKCGIPRQSLAWKFKKKIDNVSENRLGPIPVLGEATDKDFVQWSLAMHKKGLPVGRYMII